MTRFGLLKLIRRLLLEYLDTAIEDTWMPREFGRSGSYKHLHIFWWDGRRYRITVEQMEDWE